MPTHAKARPLFDREIVHGALAASFAKLDPRHQVRNPVMFVVLVVSVLTSMLVVQAVVGHGEAPAGFILAVTLWLWVTLLFANFAEAIAEGRSKAQAASLKSARKDTTAKKLDNTQVPAIHYEGFIQGSVTRVTDLLHDVNGDAFIGSGAGSVMQKALVISPAQRGASHFAFCVSLPVPRIKSMLP